VGFQVSMGEGISLGSIVFISCTSTDGCALLAHGRGLRSWTLALASVSDETDAPECRDSFFFLYRYHLNKQRDPLPF
jgi:hypothetical protein